MTGLRRFANKRDQNEPEIVRELRNMGCLVELMDKPVDLLICINGKNYLAEVKMPKGKLTDEQSAFIARGFEVWILRDVQDAINMCNMVRRQTA